MLCIVNTYITHTLQMYFTKAEARLQLEGRFTWQSYPQNWDATPSLEGWRTMILINSLNQGFVTMRKLALVFVAVSMYVPSLQAQDQRLELPTYHLTVDPADLSSLYQSPFSDVPLSRPIFLSRERSSSARCDSGAGGGLAGTQRKAGRSGLRIHPIRLESGSSTSRRNTRISR